MVLFQSGDPVYPGLLRPLWAYKPLDEPLTNSASVQDDDDLFVAMAAGAVYDLRLRAFINGNATPDFKFGWSYPAGTTIAWAVVDAQAGTTMGKLIQTDFVAIPTTGANQLVTAEGTVTVGATPGNLRFRWAQNGANVAVTTVQAGSTLRLDRVG